MGHREAWAAECLQVRVLNKQNTVASEHAVCWWQQQLPTWAKCPVGSELMLLHEVLVSLISEIMYNLRSQ
jgi:hypothetical protein